MNESVVQTALAFLAEVPLRAWRPPAAADGDDGDGGDGDGSDDGDETLLELLPQIRRTAVLSFHQERPEAVAAQSPLVGVLLRHAKEHNGSYRCPLVQAASEVGLDAHAAHAELAALHRGGVLQFELRDPAFYVRFHCAPKQTEVDDLAAAMTAKMAEVEELQRTKLAAAATVLWALADDGKADGGGGASDADGGATPGGGLPTRVASLLTTYFEDATGGTQWAAPLERLVPPTLRGDVFDFCQQQLAQQRTMAAKPKHEINDRVVARLLHGLTSARFPRSSTARTTTGGATWSSTSTSCARSRRRSSPPSTASTGGRRWAGGRGSSGVKNRQCCGRAGVRSGVRSGVRDAGWRIAACKLPARPLALQPTTRRRSRSSSKRWFSTLRGAPSSTRTAHSCANWTRTSGSAGRARSADTSSLDQARARNRASRARRARTGPAARRRQAKVARGRAGRCATYATTDIGAAARRLERLSVGGSQQRLSVVGGGQRRSGASGAPTAATTAAEPTSYAEALLPAPPPAGKSQFAFEAENPLQMHAASPADRNFQRKLSSLNNLQAETVRLERAQRAANRGGSVPAHLVYKQEMVEAGRWQI